MQDVLVHIVLLAQHQSQHFQAGFAFASGDRVDVLLLQGSLKQGNLFINLYGIIVLLFEVEGFPFFLDVHELMFTVMQFGKASLSFLFADLSDSAALTRCLEFPDLVTDRIKILHLPEWRIPVKARVRCC